LRVLVLLLTLWSGLATAAQVQGLYQAEVPVATQDQAARAQAFRSALETVLIKVTGSRGIVSEAAVQALLTDASRYVQQYGYRETQPMTMWVQFDGVVLQEALTEANLPVWMDERPTVLVWIAVQNGDRRYLLAEDSGGKAREIVQGVAGARGVPILLPLMDLEDRARVSVADVLGGFDEAVLEGSARYEADAVATAQVTALANDAWNARWRLKFGGDSLDWSFQGPTLDAVLTDGVHAIADALGARLAVVESAHPQGAMLISVEGVQSLEDFAQVRAYLENLSLVQSSRAHQVGPGYASFWVEVSGSLGDVERAVGLGDLLERAPAPVTAALPPNAAERTELPTLHFRLR
jgi:uncharacterized protein